MDPTRQLLPYGKGGGFKRYAHSAGPETQTKIIEKKIEIGPRDVEIRVRSVRFTPKGFEKRVKRNFAIFRSLVTWAWWLVFEEPGCGGWFLVNHGVLAGF